MAVNKYDISIKLRNIRSFVQSPMYVWLKISCNGSNMRNRKTIIDLKACISNGSNQLKITFDVICQNHAAVWHIARIRNGYSKDLNRKKRLQIKWVRIVYILPKCLPKIWLRDEHMNKSIEKKFIFIIFEILIF